jgi:hypothetical protein
MKIMITENVHRSNIPFERKKVAITSNTVTLSEKKNVYFISLFYVVS